VNKRDRQLLIEAAGELPEGFTMYDYTEFVDFRQGSSACRVIRFVGSSRYMVLFSYPKGPFTQPYRPSDYETLYLDENGDLQPLDPKRIHQLYKEEHGRNASWERAVSAWLKDNGGMAFKGKGWADACARYVHNLITRWQKHYSGAVDG
jgi:hypothetical protein